jgi:hypothetical protein
MLPTKLGCGYTRHSYHSYQIHIFFPEPHQGSRSKGRALGEGRGGETNHAAALKHYQKIDPLLRAKIQKLESQLHTQETQKAAKSTRAQQGTAQSSESTPAKQATNESSKSTPAKQATVEDADETNGDDSRDTSEQQRKLCNEMVTHLQKYGKFFSTWHEHRDLSFWKVEGIHTDIPKSINTTLRHGRSLMGRIRWIAWAWAWIVMLSISTNPANGGQESTTNGNRTSAE